MEGISKIARLAKGDKARTARHADVMNEIIDRLNAVLSMTLSPGGIGKFVYSDGNVVLQLNTTDTCPTGGGGIDGGGA